MRGGVSSKCAALALMLVCSGSAAQSQGTGTALPASAGSPSGAPAAALAGARMRPFAVTVNLTPVGEWTLLESGAGLFATADMLKEWRLVVPVGTTPQTYRNQQWFPLFVLPGFRARIDFATQALELEFAPTAFAATQLGQSRPEPLPLSPKLPALFVNYDVSHTRVASRLAGNSHDTGALTEWGLSWGPGVFLSSHVARNLGASDPTLKPEWRRLETTWTLDLPQSNRTLRLGDTSTRASLWGRALYYGGVQIGSNFGLTPGFIAQPIPTLAGTANGPSTVELYVNNVLRQTNSVPAGPFTVENFNQLSGAGEVRVVVRDVLGRESVVSRSFFTNAQLLAPGIVDWSLDAGRLRYNLGTVNADYRDRFVSGLYRRGVTEDLTVESRLDYARALQNAGLGATFTLPWQMLGQLALVGSRSAAVGQGGKLFFGVDQQSLRSGFGVRVGMAERTYRDLGSAATDLPYRREQAFNYRYSIDESGAIGVTAASLQSYAGGTVNTTTLSYAMRVFERGSLTLALTRLDGQTAATTVTASLALPLESRQLVTANVSRTANQVDAYVGTAAPIDGQTGTGYRLLGGQRAGQAYGEGGVYHQAGNVYLSADVNANRLAQTVRLNAQGALVWVDGGVYASRRLAESFALVDVKGQTGIGVGFQGGSLTRTDRNGQALLPRLMPYQNNAIRLDPNDLPFSAEIDNIELSVVPAWRSAVKVVFPVRSGRAALLRIVFDDGQPAAAGAEVRLAGDDKEFFVARRGEAYVTGLQDKSRLTLNWKGKSCELEVVLPPSQPDEILRLGPIACKGVAR